MCTQKVCVGNGHPGNTAPGEAHINAADTLHCCENLLCFNTINVQLMVGVVANGVKMASKRCNH